MISTNIIIILKKIINDYCKFTNNNDIKENLLISILINIQNASQYIGFNYYVIIRTIYATLTDLLTSLPSAIRILPRLAEPVARNNAAAGTACTT